MLNLTAVGNIGKDAEIKTTKNGKEYLSFSVAVNTGWGDNKSTQWVNCKKYGQSGKLAELLTKGSKVAVAGNLEASVYKDQAQLWLTVSELDIVSRPPKVDNSFDDVKGPADDNVPFDNAPF